MQVTYSTDQQQPAYWERRRITAAAHFVGCGIMLMVALSGLYNILHTAVLHAFPSLALTALFTNPVLNFLLNDILPYILMVGVPFFLASAWMHEPIRPFARHEPVEPTWFILIILLGLATFTVANLFTDAIIVVWQNIGLPLPDLPSEQDGTTTSFILNLISVAILPAILEEMSFRGFLLEKLRPLGDRFAVLMSAVLFGLLHGNIVQIPFAFLLGLFFGYVTVRTNNIFIAIFLHFLNNAISVLFDYANLVIPDWANVLYIVWLLVVLLAGTIAAMVMARGPHRFWMPLGTTDSPLTALQKHVAFWVSPFMITSTVLLIVNFVTKILEV